MTNPWLDMPLTDYEGHMTLPTVGQAKMVADEFEEVLRIFSPKAAAILGCAGGNGFDQAKEAGVVRLVGIDINAGFIAGAEHRYSGKLPGLELYCADIQGDLPAIQPVELIYAALLFEFVDVTAAIGNIRKICQRGGYLGHALAIAK